MELDHQDQDRLLGLDDISPELLEVAQKKNIVIFGLGGLGCPVALYLSAFGCQNLNFVDFDTVDQTNLSRQILFDIHDLGQKKVAVSKHKLLQRYPNIKINTYEDRLDLNHIDQLILQSDIVFDCTDNFDSRLIFAGYARKHNKWLIAGSVIRYEAQLAVFSNSSDADCCYGCLYEINNDPMINCDGGGVFPPLAGQVGTYMASEGIKAMLFNDTNLDGKIQIFDLKNNEWKTLWINKSKDCKICRN